MIHKQLGKDGKREWSVWNKACLTLRFKFQRGKVALMKWFVLNFALNLTFDRKPKKELRPEFFVRVRAGDCGTFESTDLKSSEKKKKKWKSNCCFGDSSSEIGFRKNSEIGDQNSRTMQTKPFRNIPISKLSWMWNSGQSKEWPFYYSKPKRSFNFDRTVLWQTGVWIDT